MTNIELQSVLADRIKVALSDLSMEQRQVENERTGLILDISKLMVQNGTLLLNADKTYGNPDSKASKVKETILGNNPTSGWLNKNAR